MSQPMPPSMPPPGYSPQYSFWPYYSAPPEELLAPARRAGLMLLVIGALAILLGGFGVAAIGSAANEVFADVIRQAESAKADVSQLTPALVRSAFKGMLVVVAMCGVVAVILGLVVRGGGRAAAVVAIVLLALPTLALAFLLLTAIAAGPANAAKALLVFGIPLGLLAATGAMLVGAIRAAPLVERARMQQLMMLHQQQAAYYAQAYGTDVPPVPPPPAS